MGWRRAPVRRYLFPLGAAAVVLAGTALIRHCEAADRELYYNVSIGQLYTEDVFRTGEEKQDDFATTLRLTSGLQATTARSETHLVYTPEFFKYAENGELDHLDHRLRTTWNFKPGQRSAIGLRQGFTHTERQWGFRDIQDASGGESEEILPITRRITWDLAPYHRIEMTRNWSLETGAIFRSQEYDDPGRVDWTVMGLRSAATVRVGREQRVGGELSYDILDFDGEEPQGRLDRFLSAEVLWAREEGRTFTWRSSAGLFRGTDGGASSVTEPIVLLSAAWNFQRSELIIGYNLGYSSGGGFGRARRDESAVVAISRTWGRALKTEVGASYIRREDLQDESSEVGDLDGYSLDLRASYRWPTRFGIAARLTALRQDEATGRELDYWEGSVAMTFRSAASQKR